MPKSKLLYGLHQRQRGTRNWSRVPHTGAYFKDSAVRIFQSRLLDSALSGGDTELSLRPIEKGQLRVDEFGRA